MLKNTFLYTGKHCKAREAKGNAEYGNVISEPESASIASGV